MINIEEVITINSPIGDLPFNEQSVILLCDEIERLREENNKLKLEFVSAVDKAEKYSRSAFSRNERNKELRSALTAILAVSQRYDKPTMNVITDCARAALKGDE